MPKVASKPKVELVSEPKASELSASVPKFRRGDRVDYWVTITDDNLEGFVADVLKVFSNPDGIETYWINVQDAGTIGPRMGVKASDKPAHNAITARE